MKKIKIAVGKKMDIHELNKAYVFQSIVDDYENDKVNGKDTLKRLEKLYGKEIVNERIIKNIDMVKELKELEKSKNSIVFDYDDYKFLDKIIKDKFITYDYDKKNIIDYYTCKHGIVPIIKIPSNIIIDILNMGLSVMQNANRNKPIDYGANYDDYLNNIISKDKVTHWYFISNKFSSLLMDCIFDRHTDIYYFTIE